MILACLVFWAIGFLTSIILIYIKDKKIENEKRNNRKGNRKKLFETWKSITFNF